MKRISSSRLVGPKCIGRRVSVQCMAMGPTGAAVFFSAVEKKVEGLEVVYQATTRPSCSQGGVINRPARKLDRTSRPSC
jgi:hypothetical protein